MFVLEKVDAQCVHVCGSHDINKIIFNHIEPVISYSCILPGSRILYLSADCDQKLKF